MNKSNNKKLAISQPKYLYFYSFPLFLLSNSEDYLHSELKKNQNKNKFKRICYILVAF